MLEIITRVTVRLPFHIEEMQQDQGVEFQVGDTLHYFHVIDPLNRYLPMPWKEAEDKSDLWHETDPLTLTVYCKGENLAAYREYFASHGCDPSIAKIYVVPKLYGIEYRCDGTTDMLMELIRNNNTVSERTCKWQIQRLEDGVLVNGHRYDNLPRMGDAYCDFTNVKEIQIAGKSVDPSVYTKSNPLPNIYTHGCTVVPEDPDQPVYMKMLYLAPELRRELFQVG